MSRMLRRFVMDDRGQDLVEYALLTSLLAVVGIAALKFLGSRISKTWNQVGNSL